MLRCIPTFSIVTNKLFWLLVVNIMVRDDVKISRGSAHETVHVPYIGLLS